jgi:hypothetical protein
MTAKLTLIDQAKAMCSPQTDMALAARVGVTRSAVSVWRKGGKITPDHLERLASIAQLDGEIVMRVMEEQAESPAQRRVWRSVLDRLSAAAAVLALVVVAMPGVARANTQQIQSLSADDGGSMYIMFKASPRTLAYRSPQSPALLCQAKKPASPACPSRPGSYGFLHRPIRVLCMTQAIQPQTKPTPATMISSSLKAAPFSP